MKLSLDIRLFQKKVVPLQVVCYSCVYERDYYRYYCRRVMCYSSSCSSDSKEEWPV